MAGGKSPSSTIGSAWCYRRHVVAELLTEIRPAIQTLLVAAALGLTAIVAQAIRVLQRRAVNWLEGLSADARWRAAIERLETAATAAVDEVEQRLAADFRAAGSNPGKLTGEQGRRLASEALTIARQHFGSSTWERVLADLELSPERVTELLRTQIEAAVRRRKLEVPGVLVTATAGEPVPVDPAAVTVRTSLEETDGPGDSGDDLR
jgi:hypothetical protein